MKRNRFVPHNDTLEDRKLLSTTPWVASSSHYNSTAAQLSTYQERQQRIDRLPNFLETVSPGRPLPASTITTIQNDLRSVVGRLQPASSNGLYTYNRDLRGLLASASANTGNVQPVLTMFTKNLRSTGMPEPTVTSLTNSVNQLARVSVNTTSNPPSVVANDTSLILEVALAVGKPLPAPKLPHLVQADTIPGQPGHTRNPNPTLTGTYEPDMTMYVMDYQGTRILGSAPTDSKGNYQIKLSQSLQAGRNPLQVVAVGPGGIGSLPSSRLGIGLSQAPVH